MTRKALLFFLLVPAVLCAQEEKSQKFGITFSGYVKSDFFTDSRQTFSPREGHFLLWPQPILKDVNGKDINDGFNTNFLPVQSQLSGKITGPDVFGAKTSGVLEGDFFGTTNADINLLRLRHAYMKINWNHSELLMGQYWHPLFNTACFPATVSFNTGAPINPFSRDPQIRFGYSRYGFKLSIAAVTQRDYPSYGPGGGSPNFLRNSATPELYGELTYTRKNDARKSTLSSGVLFGTKTIVPRLSSTVDSITYYKVQEKVQSVAASVFVNIKLRPVTIKITGIYGENLSDVLSITGFAVTGIADKKTGKQTYAPTASRILWADIHTNGAKWQAGVFAGFNKNIGTTMKMENPAAPVYGLTTDIALIYRISPRIIYNVGKLRFAAELEYTVADFAAKGTKRDGHGLPKETERVANTRCLLAAYYFF